MTVNDQGKQCRVTDKMMVDVAQKYEGWAGSIYRFGCEFIHLSNFHGYNSSNPLETISEEEKSNVLGHMRHYHGGPKSDNPTFTN
ncbi:hypothetical protein I6M49_22000 [Shewanella algae]|uniref:hypothetical protein n=1 Tax=Shewanella algae TaxID=38313 RepID=UPI001AAC6670|nr:hypothetical protein [Shewanella algae]MBO2656119.1 hypothetical protein [Shewanella algae]